MDALEQLFGIKNSYVKTDENGVIDLDDLESLLKNDQEKTLVSLMHVNNEIGNILRFRK